MLCKYLGYHNIVHAWFLLRFSFSFIIFYTSTIYMVNKVVLLINVLTNPAICDTALSNWYIFS